MAAYEPLTDAGNFLDLVGPLHRDGDRLALRIEARHLNAAGSAHGGLLAVLADHALGRAINAAAGEEQGAVTASLTTDYLAPAREGDLVEARAEVERIGGNLAFGDCALTVDGKEIVRARAVFAVLGDSRR